jgi:hypothetical protein
MDMSALMGLVRGGSGRMFAGGSPVFQEKTSASMYDPIGGAAPMTPQPLAESPMVQPAGQDNMGGGGFLQQLLGMLQGGNQMLGGASGSRMMYPGGSSNFQEGWKQANPMGMLMQRLRGVQM